MTPSLADIHPPHTGGLPSDWPEDWLSENKGRRPLACMVFCGRPSAASSADHSCPSQGLSCPWKSWLLQKDRCKRVLAHCARHDPACPLSEDEVNEATAMLCKSLKFDDASVQAIPEGQPIRLSLLSHLTHQRH